MQDSSATRRIGFFALPLLAACFTLFAGCSTAPRAGNEESYVERSRETTAWFERNVSGLSSQIDRSAGFIIFPDVARWGIILTGGQFGRGTLCRPDGTQIGWAAINNASIGLQAGVVGFRMLVVFENEEVLNRFRSGTLTGSAAGILVAAEAGRTGSAPFANGVAAYQGASRGLMAGVNVGLDLMRFAPLEPGETPGRVR